MANASKILPLVIGAINEREVYTSADINCNPDGSSEVKDIFSGMEFEVLFPSQEGDIVPLIGGSIAKIKLGDDLWKTLYPTTESKVSESYQRLVNKINVNLTTKANNLKDFIRASDEPLGAYSTSKIVDLHIVVNKFLEKTNFYNKNLQAIGIPSLKLSSIISSQFESHTDLNKEIDRARRIGIKPAGLSEVGSFKFIPIETVQRIYEIISEKFSENIALSGDSYGCLKDDLADIDNNSDKDKLIAKSILNLFPILRLDEDVISGEDSQNTIGYYTVYKDSVYIKTPDLSGRDSSGSSSNIYGLGEEVEEAFNFAFEMVVRSNYGAISFEHLAPASISVVDEDYDMPASEGGTISVKILKEGVSEGCKFYLSPIDPDASAKVEGVRGVKSSTEGIELFTAPNLSVPYFDDSDELSPLLPITDIMSSSLKDCKGTALLFPSYDQGSVDALGNSVAERLKSFFNFDSGVGVLYFSEGNKNDKTKLYFDAKSGVKNLSFADFGVPLFVANQSFIDSPSQYCGLLNRPDIFLGRRDEEGSYRRNDRKYFSDKIYASKDFFLSITPNIAREEQVPKLWIKSSSEKEELDADEGEEVYEILFKGGSSSDGFNIDDFRGRETTEFALYCVDKLGQISRASGPNIVLKKYAPLQIGVTPNGFRESGVILKAGVVLEELKIQLDDQPVSLDSIKIYSEESGGILIEDVDLSGVDVASTGSGFSIKFNKAIEDIFGSNNGRFWISINDSENRLEIFIADPSVELVTQLPGPSPERVLFQDPNGLKAQKFGKVIDSVPILLNGSNAQIRLKYNKKVFKEGSEIYAYLAINGLLDNLNILLHDVGFDWESDNANGIKFTKTFGKAYFIPTNMEWEFGGSHFKRISNKKALLSFPGPSGGLNISRFNKFVGSDDGSPPAYLILSNKKLRGEGGAEVNLEANSYAVIPIGSSESGNKKPAFINPPHILGMIAKIPGNRGSSNFAITTESQKISNYFDKIRGIKEEEVRDSNTVGPLITSDGLDRLAVIFTGSNVERRISRSYTTYIGSTKIKSKRAGRVVRLDEAENLLLLNFKKIRDVKDVGWTNITISKKDRRFKVNYDSTVYSRSTIRFTCSEDLSDPSCTDDGITKTIDSGNSQIATLQSGETRNILSMDGSGSVILSESANIFPDVNNYGLSQLPYFKADLSLDGSKYSNKDIAEVGESFAYFRNPIKIYPDSELYLKLFLSDTDTEKNSLGEFTSISTSGRTTVDIDLDSARDSLDNIKEQAASAKDTINNEISNLDDELSNLDEIGRSEEEIRQEKDDLQKQLDAYDEKEAEADSSVAAADAAEAERIAAQQALDELGPDASQEALDAAAAALEDAAAAVEEAMDAVNNAIDAVNDALSLINALADNLSRLAMIANGILDDVEDALSASKRADDFYGVDIKNVFIQKNTSIRTSNIASNRDQTEFRLIFNVRFDNVAAIQFNTPQIISIRENGIDNERILPADFKSIKVKEPKILFLETIGTNKDTKLEINRIRTATKIVKELGIFKFLRVEIENPDKYFSVGKDPCLEIALTNSNENSIRLAGQVNNDLAINIDKVWSKHIGGGDRIKQGPIGDLMDKLSDNPLKFINVKLDKANIAKELMQSFCDMSFHLTAELSLQLRNFKVLLIPIKVILCIIDVICALLHPIRLAFAIIRLFLCLYDLILLLPQLAVPAMLLSLILHILELLLCVILKTLSIVNAINEIITALEVAIQEKNYPAIVALEETLNEHIFSLEADLQVLEPILTILGLFLELLQLVFAFPCQIGADEDDPMCIDPSMLAGIILGKVAPFGTVAPDVLLPLAQTYTTLEPGESTYGNTPASSADEGNNFSDNDILKETSENAGEPVVPSNAGYGGNDLTGLTDSTTGQPIVIGDNGFFSGDNNEDGRLDNVDYTTLRFDEGGSNFEATFSVSFTKSTKKFNLFTGPDPRLVEFQFNERGLTNPLAFNWFLALFFRKKNIEIFQTLDSPPGFVVANAGGNSLIVNDGDVGFTSPVDGASDFNGSSFTGFYLEERAGGTYQPKPLTVKIDIETRAVDPDTGEETIVTSGGDEIAVYKTFKNVPMIAMVDDEFNVYFVEEGEGGAGGIVVENIGGVQCITSINAKMINFPSAPKKKFSKEDKEVYRTRDDIDPKSDRAGNPSKVPQTADVPAGQAMVYQQANANWLINSDTSGSYEDGPDDFNADFGGTSDNAEEIKAAIDSDIDGGGTGEYLSTAFDAGGNKPDPPPFPTYGVYDWANGSKKEQEDFGNSIDTVKVFDFPTLYFVDMRHVADDIAAACGSKPTELLLGQDVFTEDGQNGLADLVEGTRECVQSFKDFFLSQKEKSPGVPEGIVPKIRSQLEIGKVPEKIDVNSVIAKYNDTRACLEDKINESCEFVINPLNTSFKLLNDIDETPLTEYIDPEQQNLANLINYDLVDELEFDTDLQGFPQITGAMEYASGIGDSAAVTVGEKALIRIIPRDCYDDVLPLSLDLTESIVIDILEDETGSAELVAPDVGPDKIIRSNGEYTLAISASAPGAVKIKATICSVVVQAVTDRSIVPTVSSPAEVDCVDDAGVPSDADEVFAPGALAKVDRVLTILFVSSPAFRSGDDQDAKLATPSPQVFGTNLEN